jgi:hypothetical protein
MRHEADLYLVLALETGGMVPGEDVGVLLEFRRQRKSALTEQARLCGHAEVRGGRPGGG